jgi:DNA-binding GntR family transcriptional regulator
MMTEDARSNTIATEGASIRAIEENLGLMTSTESISPDSRGPASEPIYTRIQGMIMAIDLEPGQRLTVDILARDLDVSPTPVREALARLESEGLVTKTHLRGYRVAEQQTREHFDQMFDIRLHLEPYIAGLAAARATSDQKQELLQLQQLIGETSETSRSTGTYHQFAALDAQFHRMIAVASGNVLAAETIDRFHIHLHLFRLHRDQGVADRAITEHQRIVDFILEGEQALAGAAMLTHITRSWERVQKAFDDVGA